MHTSMRLVCTCIWLKSNCISDNHPLFSISLTETSWSLLQHDVKTSISLFMSYVHTTANEMSKVYLATERRYNYTTPKTFLEQIKLYQNLLAKKRMELIAKIERLENGLMKLQSTASQVREWMNSLCLILECWIQGHGFVAHPELPSAPCYTALEAGYFKQPVYYTVEINGLFPSLSPFISPKESCCISFPQKETSLLWNQCHCRKIAWPRRKIIAWIPSLLRLGPATTVACSQSTLLGLALHQSIGHPIPMGLTKSKGR